jgi:fructose-1,6-bisphosphatase/inositol monophosphatase family enzyme
VVVLEALDRVEPNRPKAIWIFSDHNAGEFSDAIKGRLLVFPITYARDALAKTLASAPLTASSLNSATRLMGIYRVICTGHNRANTGYCDGATTAGSCDGAADGGAEGDVGTGGAGTGLLGGGGSGWPGFCSDTDAKTSTTDADLAAEASIRSGVSEVFPSAIFVGEEAVASDPGILEAIASARLAIIIDPVDGTTNFAWGMPLFGVLAAVVEDGITVAGIIYEPVSGDSVFAVKGGSAWAKSRNGGVSAIHVAKPTGLSNMVGTTSWYLMPEPMRTGLAANLGKIRANFSYRCAAHEYRITAEGLVDFLLHYNFMPWDHAAGVLIHTEAGGYSALLDGSPYLPTKFTGDILSAADRDSWQVIYDALLV